MHALATENSVASRATNLLVAPIGGAINNYSMLVMLLPPIGQRSEVSTHKPHLQEAKRQLLRNDFIT